jgi:hypothetical protein
MAAAVPFFIPSTLPSSALGFAEAPLRCIPAPNVRFLSVEFREWGFESWVLVLCCKCTFLSNVETQHFASLRALRKVRYALYVMKNQRNLCFYSLFNNSNSQTYSALRKMNILL